MAGFGSMPALSSTSSSSSSSGAAPGTGPMGLAVSDMETFNACIAFDEALLSDPVHGIANLPFTPAAYDLDAFSTTFEDPFSYPARPFDGAGAGAVALDAAAFGSADAPSPQDLDSKLLGFGPPIPGKATLVSETGQLVEPAMTGELYGMFFVAEDVFGADSCAPPGRPLELTCYRRNLWQISAQITLPRNVSHYVDDHGRRAPVAELAASISAVESIEGRAAEMITIPWRGSSNNNNNNNNSAPLGATDDTTTTTTTTTTAKAVGAPPIVPLDLASGHEVDGGSRVSLPVSWKRLQFKHATANNGRRKGLQQHYIVQINLLVKTETGEHIKVAEVQSGPVIVRGRSPRNFDSRREVPLGDRRPLERRNTDGAPSAAALKQQLQLQQQQQQQQSLHSNQDGGDLVHGMQRYNSLGSSMQSASDWATPRPFTAPSAQQHPSKKLAMSPSSSLNRPPPPVPSWASLDMTSPTNNSNNNNIIINKFPSTPNKPAASFPPPPPPPSKPQRTSAATTTARGTAPPQPLPLSLSLSEDERSPPATTNPPPDGTHSPQFVKNTAAATIALPLAAAVAPSTAGTAAGAAASIITAAGPAVEANSNSNNNNNNGMNSNANMASPSDAEDLLYEYFPLSLDDWTPPVDAIYRPHVVHHTVVPPEVKAQQVRSKAKRYFAAE